MSLMKETKSINVKLTFKLKPEEMKFLKSLLSKGKESVRVVRRAQVLNLFDQGYTSPTISGDSYQPYWHWCQLFFQVIS